jgi:inhibitor of KinA sporulation pathway (predicted exonuclease)
MTILQRPARPVLTVFDLEFTAWECSMAGHWLKPGEFKEVVQIGALRLDRMTFSILEEFDRLVRPRVNRTLSPYFEKLTGITNAQLQERGVDFRDAYADFLAFASEGPVACFGGDGKVLEDNLRLYGLKSMRPLSDFEDLRFWFAEQGLDPRGLDSCDIGPKLGAAFSGRRHNALDDCRSLVSAMAMMAAPAAAE